MTEKADPVGAAMLRSLNGYRDTTLTRAVVTALEAKDAAASDDAPPGLNSHDLEDMLRASLNMTPTPTQNPTEKETL